LKKQFLGAFWEKVDFSKKTIFGCSKKFDFFFFQKHFLQGLKNFYQNLSSMAFQLSNAVSSVKKY
jgi:hypothetical protein